MFSPAGTVELVRFFQPSLRDLLRLGDMIVRHASRGAGDLLQRNDDATVLGIFLGALHRRERQCVDIGQHQDVVREIADSNVAMGNIGVVQEHVVVDEIKVIAVRED